ncbi:MAG: hypothetical protein ACPGLV_06840 [Bacteroidia bacterium]
MKPFFLIIVVKVFIVNNLYALDSLERSKIDEYVTRSQWDSAKHVAFTCLKSNNESVSEKIEDFIWLADIGLRQNNIAFQRDFVNRALELKQNATEIEKSEIAFAYANLLFQAGQLDSAKNIYHFIKGKFSDKLISKASIRNLANIYVQTNKNDSAEFYCNKLVSDFKLETINDSLYYFNIKGAIEFNKLNFINAISWFNLQIGAYSRLNDYMGLYESYVNKSQAYESSGNFEMALKTKDSVIFYLHKLREYSSLQLEKEMEVKYQTWEKELAAKAAESKAKSRSLVILVLGAGLVLIIPLLIWFSYSVRTIRAKNKELEITHNDLETVNERLEKRVEERTLQLEEHNKRLERYAFATSHKLRKPLANILGLISLFAEDTKSDQIIDMLEKSSEELDHAVRHMGEILDRKSDQKKGDG